MKQTEYELRKVSEGVFDKSTLLTLYDLTKKGVFDRLISIVSTGKEANVYHAISEGGEVAVKIFTIEASDFRTMEKYIIGDRRFASWKNRRQLISLWAKKEFKNLSKIYGTVRCPKPLGVEKNVLVMEFIGKDGVPVPRLKDKPADDPEKFFKEVMECMRGIHRAGLVHGDLSEYNILNDGAPIIIDLSMGVLLDHPRAEEFLIRDVANIVNYFRKQGVAADEKEVLSYVKKEDA